MDPNKVHVVNAYNRKVYGSFDLDIDARQYMRNMLLKECDGPNDDDARCQRSGASMRVELRLHPSRCKFQRTCYNISESYAWGGNNG